MKRFCKREKCDKPKLHYSHKEEWIEPPTEMKNAEIRIKFSRLKEYYPNLKPCPFCGGERIARNPQPDGFLIKCETCQANKRVYTKFKSQANHEWNHRV